MSASLILTGQLLGTAFACGLNLYLTVVVLGVAARMDLLPDLPPGLGGLENGIVIGVAAALYVAEFIADRIPGVDHVWEAIHTLIRPAAAGLLVALALMGAPTHIQLGIAAAAAVTALAAHGTKAGVRMILTPRWIDDEGRIRPRRTIARTAASLLEDVAAAGIAISALLFPGVAVFVIGAALLLLLAAGPRLWRAAMLGLRAVTARARGFFGRPGWRSRADLPRGIRRAIPEEPMGSRPPRAAAAAVRGLPSAGAYRHGWLVFSCDGTRFIYSAGFRAHCADIPVADHVELRRGLLADTLELRSGHQGTVTFFLLKDGPPADVTAAELLGTST